METGTDARFLPGVTVTGETTFILNLCRGALAGEMETGTDARFLPGVTVNRRDDTPPSK